jgi:hypothetical protein
MTFTTTFSDTATCVIHAPVPTLVCAASRGGKAHLHHHVAAGD